MSQVVDIVVKSSKTPISAGEPVLFVQSLLRAIRETETGRVYAFCALQLKRGTR
jgi:hypothetical protein